MAPPSLTYLLDNVGSSTIEHRLQGLIDNVYGSNPLAARLLQRDRITVEGGRDIRQRVIYGKKPGGWYQGLDPFDLSKVESRTEMVFNWKQCYVNITVDGLSMLQNSGPEQISDLIQDEMDEADMTAADKIGDAIFGDGSADGGKTLTGLRAAVDDGTTYTTYGGITRSSTALTPGKAVSGNFSTTATTFSLSAMNTAFGTAVVGAEKPDLILTTQTIWNKWWERSQPAQRIPQGSADSNMAKLGFDSIKFNGADVVVDSHCPASSVYFINTKWVKLVCHSKRQWNSTGWKYPTNQDSAVNQLLFAGELVVMSPRLQYGMSAVS